MLNTPGRVERQPGGVPDDGDARSTAELFRSYAAARDLATRDRLISLHERLVHYFALRFSTAGGAAYEDLVQVGYIGLITAIDRFDPEHGSSFVTFAAPTIIGVIKRYLRDHTWGLKVPRRLRELGITLRRLREEEEARLGRAPTVAELTLHTGASEERIAEAMELERAYQPMSLDTPRGDEPNGDAACTWEAIGGVDPRIELVEEKETLRQAIESLDERERYIIRGRFFGEASQSQIAQQLGMSQMHVSRLERQALQRLRQLLQ